MSRRTSLALAGLLGTCPRADGAWEAPVLQRGQCVGSWTKQWTHRFGDVPEQVQRTIANMGSPALNRTFRRHECPFGSTILGSVTWPNPAPDLRDVVNPMDTWDVYMVINSLSPYAVSLWLVVLFVCKRGTRELWLIIWIVLFLVLNEVILKDLLGEPRPGTHLEIKTYDGKLAGSCLTSCGMPSSHAGLTTGLFLLLFLDAVLRVRRRPVARKKGLKALTKASSSCRKFVILACDIKLLSGVKYDTLHHYQFICFTLFWAATLLTSPLSRIALYDHSIIQVVTGQQVGVVSALLYWIAVRKFQSTYRSAVDNWICCGLVHHDFPKPDSDLELDKLATLDDGGSGSDLAGSDLESSSSETGDS